MSKRKKQELQYVTPDGRPLSWWNRRVMNVTKRRSDGINLDGFVDSGWFFGYVLLGLLSWITVPSILGAGYYLVALAVTSAIAIPVALVFGPEVFKRVWNNRVRPFLKRRRAKLIASGVAADILQTSSVAMTVRRLNEAETAALTMQSNMRGETLQKIRETRWNLVCMENDSSAMAQILGRDSRLDTEQYEEAKRVHAETTQAATTLRRSATNLAEQVLATMEVERAASITAVLAASRAVDKDLAVVEAAKRRLESLPEDTTSETTQLLTTYSQALVAAP